MQASPTKLPGKRLTEAAVSTPQPERAVCVKKKNTILCLGQRGPPLIIETNCMQHVGTD